MSNYDIMELIIDKRNTNIVYADKVNYQHATNNDIIKITNVGKVDKIKNIIEILSAGTNLSKEAINVLYVINTLDAYSTIAEIFDMYVAIIKKSRSTFDRGIAELKGKAIIRVNANNQVLLSQDYNCRNSNNVKYVIIELNPSDTSSGVNI